MCRDRSDLQRITNSRGQKKSMYNQRVTLSITDTENNNHNRM